MVPSQAVAVSLQAGGRLEAENAALRHQVIVLQRKAHGRIEFNHQAGRAARRRSFS
jgi:hypothetical protein